jgi:hypothetical protein
VGRTLVEPPAEEPATKVEAAPEVRDSTEKIIYEQR